MNTLLLSMSGSTIVTLVAIGIIALFAIVGTVVGFAKTFIKTFGTIFAIILAIVLCSKVATLFENWFGMISFFSGKMSALVDNIFGTEVTSLTLSEVAADNTLITSSNRVSVLFANIILRVIDSGAPETATVGSVLAETFGYYVSIIICAVAIFIIVKIIFWIIGKIIGKLHKFKPFGVVDRLLGFALGLIQGLLWVQILSAVIGFIPIGFFQEVSGYISESGFITFVNKVNVIGWIKSAFSEVNVADFVKNALSKG